MQSYHGYVQSMRVVTGMHFRSRCSDGARFSSSPMTSRPALGPTHRGLFLRGRSRGLKLVTHLHLVPRSIIVELYLLSPIRLHGIVLNLLSTGTTFPCLYLPPYLFWVSFHFTSLFIPLYFYMRSHCRFYSLSCIARLSVEPACFTRTRYSSTRSQQQTITNKRMHTDLFHCLRHGRSTGGTLPVAVLCNFNKAWRHMKIN
jgi:hypothetical protein